MIFKRILLLFILIAAILAILPGQSNVDTDSKEDPADLLYMIGAKDLLKISVFNVPELNITVRVSEDGTITLPLIGNIKVEGMTKIGLEKHLSGLLEQNYLKNAQVTIFIEEYQSKVVSVIGAVKKPDAYELLGDMTLLELLTMTGGLAENVSDRIIIIRKVPGGNNVSLTIKIDDLMLKGDPKANIPLRPGDIVNIPVESYMNIYIFGEVKNPGHLKMLREGEISLLRAVAQAGGFTSRARKGSVMVKRNVNGKEVEIRINIKSILKGKKKDFILQNNDIIHVPQSVL